MYVYVKKKCVLVAKRCKLNFPDNVLEYLYVYDLYIELFDS